MLKHCYERHLWMSALMNIALTLYQSDILLGVKTYEIRGFNKASRTE